VNDDVQADDDVGNLSKAKLDNLHDRFPDTMDGAFLTIYGLLFLVGIVASLLVESHPVFIVIIIILMAFLMISAGFISNAWEEFAQDDEVVSFSSSFPYTNWILSNLLLNIAVMLITFGGIIYFKQR